MLPPARNRSPRKVEDTEGSETDPIVIVFIIIVITVDNRPEVVPYSVRFMITLNGAINVFWYSAIPL